MNGLNSSFTTKRSTNSQVSKPSGMDESIKLSPKHHKIRFCCSVPHLGQLNLNLTWTLFEVCQTGSCPPHLQPGNNCSHPQIEERTSKKSHPGSGHALESYKISKKKRNRPRNTACLLMSCNVLPHGPTTCIVCACAHHLGVSISASVAGIRP